MKRMYQVFKKTADGNLVGNHGPCFEDKEQALAYGAQLLLSNPTWRIFVGVIGWEINFPQITKVRVTKLDRQGESNERLI